MDYIKNAALVLTIVGGLNWGLVGFFNFNLVSAIFGDMSLLSRIIYMLVGISSLFVIYITSNYWLKEKH